MTDLHNEKVQVNSSTFGSLKTYITESGVYATFSGWSTTLIDLIVPLDIFDDIACNVLTDFLDIPLKDFALPTIISEYTDFYLLVFD